MSGPKRPLRDQSGRRLLSSLTLLRQKREREREKAQKWFANSEVTWGGGEQARDTPPQDRFISGRILYPCPRPLPISGKEQCGAAEKSGNEAAFPLGCNFLGCAAPNTTAPGSRAIAWLGERAKGLPSRPWPSTGGLEMLEPRSQSGSSRSRRSRQSRENKRGPLPKAGIFPRVRWGPLGPEWGLPALRLSSLHQFPRCHCRAESGALAESGPVSSHLLPGRERCLCPGKKLGGWYPGRVALGTQAAVAPDPDSATAAPDKSLRPRGRPGRLDSPGVQIAATGSRPCPGRGGARQAQTRRDWLPASGTPGQGTPRPAAPSRLPRTARNE